MKKIIEDLNWRYAAKKYDPTKKLSEEQLFTIRESLRLTPSAYGLQPLKFLFVETPETRAEIKNIAHGQTQIVDASHLLIICAHTSIDEAYLDKYVDRVTEVRNTPPERAAAFGDFLKKNVLAIPAEHVEPWNVRQAYIALGQVLHTCASMRVDATPMEGFDAQKLDEYLNLSSQGLKSVLLCPIGFRAEDDVYHTLPKVRKASEQLIEIL